MGRVAESLNDLPPTPLNHLSLESEYLADGGRCIRKHPKGFLHWPPFDQHLHAPIIPTERQTFHGGGQLGMRQLPHECHATCTIH